MYTFDSLSRLLIFNSSFIFVRNFKYDDYKLENFSKHHNIIN